MKLSSCTKLLTICLLRVKMAFSVKSKAQHYLFWSMKNTRIAHIDITFLSFILNPLVYSMEFTLCFLYLGTWMKMTGKIFILEFKDNQNIPGILLYLHTSRETSPHSHHSRSSNWVSFIANSNGFVYALDLYNQINK